MSSTSQLAVAPSAGVIPAARLARASVADGCRVIEIDETSGETLNRVAWLADGGSNPGCAFLTTLRRGSWAVSLLAGDLLLSYVLRGSPSSMCVETSQGRQRRVDAGGLMLCAGPQPGLRRKKARAGPACEVIDLVLPAVSAATAVPASVRSDDATHFVNSRSTCIRVLLGRWGLHGTRFDSLHGFWLLDIDIIPGGSVELPTHSCAVNALLMTGTLSIDEEVLSATAPLMRRSAAGAITISSTSGASFLLFASGC
jgi:hypothetical protein